MMLLFHCAAGRTARRQRISTTRRTTAKDFILRGADVGVVSFQFGLDDNPALTRTTDLLRRQYTGLWFRRFILGQLRPLRLRSTWTDVHGRGCPAGDEADLRGDRLRHWNLFAAVLLGVGVDRKLYAVSEWRWTAGSAAAARGGVRGEGRRAGVTDAGQASGTPKDRPSWPGQDVAPPYLVIDRHVGVRSVPLIRCVRYGQRRDQYPGHVDVAG